jgi:TRAP-type C4-dicarboxylate transport system substrate-binding protein
VIDPRVVAVRKGGNAVITPADMAGVKFRVPGSAMLQQYYRMVGANPTPVAWGETPSAIKQGVADALDPSVGALHVFGFKDILSHVTFTQAVPGQSGLFDQPGVVQQPAVGRAGRHRVRR